MDNLLRHLPSTHELLQQLHNVEVSHSVKVDACRYALEKARRIIQTTQQIPDLATLLLWTHERLEAQQQPSLRPVINASGVIIHTNLGRAPLSDEAITEMQAVGRYYNNLEYDIALGQRGQRQKHIDDILCELSGAEASLVVNNNAAAVYLVLSALASGHEIIISRGELVEIGGGFRIPDVMLQSGAILVEVGTTNRTHLKDYRSAITERTVAIMRVHTSNFKQIGFVKQVDLADVTALAHQHRLIMIDDLGSGTFIDTSQFGLSHEPMIQESITAGVDVILFSGDKLLGGPQAGIVLGKRELIERMSQHPLMRALRPDKTTLVGLARTLQHYRDGDALQKIPIWQMISMSLETIKARAMHWQSVVGGDVVLSDSTVGGGSLPTDTLPTWALRLSVPQLDDFAARLRQFPHPVIARIQDQAIWFDPRTVFPQQDQDLIAAIQYARGI
ncbi:MAG: L-seryl-tRNA(Sec) selenium transferase [Phototrophicales bacterium]|nr:MAG: L-seryl-tRNA(Sec) selenium transferase [Phototrophicales bacterium]